MKILGKEISTAVIVAIIGVAVLIGSVVYAVASNLVLPLDGRIITPASVSSSATMLNFGSTTAGGPALPQAFTLHNNGDLPTEELTMTYTLSNNAVGTIVWDAEGKIIAPGNDLQVTVTFTPDADAPTEDFTGTLTIAYDS